MFNFQDPFDPDSDGLAELSHSTVVHEQCELGHVSHVLIDHKTSMAQWTIVTDHVGTHRALPVGLLDEDEDNDLLHVVVDLADLPTLVIVGLPDESHTTVQFRTSVNALVDNLQTSTTAHVEALSADYDVVAVPAPPVPVVHNRHHGVDFADGNTHPQNSGADEFSYPDVVRGGAVAYGDFHPDFSQPGTTAPTSELTRRELVADLPKSVAINAWFGVEMSIIQTDVIEPPRGPVLDIPGGVTVTVIAAVPSSFDVSGDLAHDISVPDRGDSSPVLFQLRPKTEGSFPLRFTAYRDGTCLGRLEVEVSVGKRTSATNRGILPSLDVANIITGEVSLQITYDDAKKTFEFLFAGEHGDRVRAPSRLIAGDIRDRIESLIPQFDSYAAGRSLLDKNAARKRMQNEGYRLWKQLVPDEIKAAIWENKDDIKQMTIYCDREVVPWELLYPVGNKGETFGFLVDQFPVVRWVMNSKRSRLLTLSSPTFVVPDGSPDQAFSEIRNIAARLMSVAPPTLRDRETLIQAMDSPSFDCLHFACHNHYDAEKGSYIRFTDGDFRPVDMEISETTKPLATTKPLVFLNACRTHGSAPTYTSLESWAHAFLHAGAAAVIGTSWAVRDSTARLFAETVYEQLHEGQTLGDSVKEARQRASAELGDSTWLAYTVYGDPRARAEES